MRKEIFFGRKGFSFLRGNFSKILLVKEKYKKKLCTLKRTETQMRDVLIGEITNNKN